ncbi:MAG: C1 family peptidase [Bacteroidota bacterium]
MKKIHQLNVTLLLLFLSFGLTAQVDMAQKNAYDFKVEKSVECTEVKSQDRTGTCWSFATASFIESELMRKGKGTHDLSEMFVVKNIYKDKARNYVLRQGKANFSQGSLSHDLMNIAARYGMMPEEAFSGKLPGEERHDHSELSAVLKGMLDGLLERKRLSPKWKKAFESVLDVYLGTTPEQFTYQGKNYTPDSFVKSMGFDANDYVSLTSYTHHPFYNKFILEIPDNYSNGAYYNLPIDEMMKVIDYAIGQGYSVAWDGDVSEKGFSAKNGIAVVPENEKREDLFMKPGKEKMIDQQLRQETFESYATTDDHLMHMTGIAKDQNGTKYYLIKNSWGEISEYKGYLHMSENYTRLKTVSIMVHKDAIPDQLAKKLSL